MDKQSVSALFFFVGICALLGSGVWYTRTVSFVNDAIVATGTVIELKHSRPTGSGSNSGTYKPRVEFMTRDGRRIEFISSSGSDPPIFSVGEQVKILYLPFTPKQAKINTFFSLWGGVLFLGGIGISLVIIGKFW